MISFSTFFFSIFSITTAHHYIQEVEEILELLKSTWRVLGINETIHYTCYAWVLFRQVLWHYFFFFFDWK